MANENDKVDVLDEPINAPDDTTDWEARARDLENKISRARDSRKSQKDKYESDIAGLKAQIELIKSSPDSKGNKTDEESRLLQKVERMTLRAAGITDADEVELARTTAKKWGMDLDEVVDDEDFKAKLDKIRTAKANADATSNIRAGAGSSGAKNTLEYWTQWAKDNPGQVPQITDKKLLAQFMRSMMQNASTGGKKFYND